MTANRKVSRIDRIFLVTETLNSQGKVYENTVYPGIKLDHAKLEIRIFGTRQKTSAKLHYEILFKFRYAMERLSIQGRTALQFKNKR